MRRIALIGLGVTVCLAAALPHVVTAARTPASMAAELSAGKANLISAGTARLRAKRHSVRRRFRRRLDRRA